MNTPALALVVAAAFISVEFTQSDPPKKIGCQASAVATVDSVFVPQDTSARIPFLDPVALFSDRVYVVRPLAVHAEGVSKGTVQRAEFIGGQAAMVSYLKENVLLNIYPGIGWLKPPLVHFSVDATGAPADVQLVATSGNESLDKALVRIFNDMPRWTPATDGQGRSIAQSFEFVVGTGGC